MAIDGKFWRPLTEFKGINLPNKYLFTYPIAILCENLNSGITVPKTCLRDGDYSNLELSVIECLCEN